MISDDSFFIVNSGGKNYFTKAGAFEVDASGTLCTSDGATVMGWQPDPTDPTRIVANQVAALRIMSPENMYTEPEATTNTHYSGNIDPKDPQLVEGKPSQMQFYDSLGNLCTAKLSFKEEADGQYSVRLVDILDPDDKSIFVQRNGDGTYTNRMDMKVTFGDVEYSLAAGNFYEDTGKVKALTPTGTGNNFINFVPGKGTFKGAGAADTGTAKSMKFNIDAGVKLEGLYKEIDVDFSEMTMYSTSGKSNFAPDRGGVNSVEGAGKMTGKMYGVSVDTSGKIYGVYDNGDQKLVGQIAVASFANPSGLEAVGNNRFAETQNSGNFDGIGQDISATGGKLSSGVLEMSNVDLSQQFTDMIVTQRGFQANSRIITTSDTMLEELINLKR